jgi:hypothetical protein
MFFSTRLSPAAAVHVEWTLRVGSMKGFMMATSQSVERHAIPASGSDGESGPASSDTLQSFTLDDLAQYTREGAFGPTASSDFRVFYVGRDDVHGVLVHLFTRVRLSVNMNMFGYDDDQLNQILIDLATDPTVMVQVTLDKSQSTGAHEKAILSSDAAKDPSAYAADFAVGQSDTRQPHQGRCPRRHRRLRRLHQLVELRGRDRHQPRRGQTAPRVQGAEQHLGRVRQPLRNREILRPTGLRTRRRHPPAGRWQARKVVDAMTR